MWYICVGEDSTWAALSASPPDLPRAAAGITLLPLLAAFTLSIAYHTCMAAVPCCNRDSTAAYDALLCIDVAGVVIALALVWVIPMIFAFGRHPALLLGFGAAHGLAMVAGFAATRSKDQTERIVPLGLLLLSHYAGIAARTAGYGAECAPAVRLYAWSEVFLFAGGVINGLFLPERFWPGKLDYGLNSHQLMHLSTLIATPLLFYGVREDARCFVTGA